MQTKILYESQNTIFIILLLILSLGIALTVVAVTVYQSDNDGVITTIHEYSDGFSWSIVDTNGEDPVLVT